MCPECDGPVGGGLRAVGSSQLESDVVNVVIGDAVTF
jgi:hypothetical protein